jgi:hypothetical protein
LTSPGAGLSPQSGATKIEIGIAIEIEKTGCLSPLDEIFDSDGNFDFHPDSDFDPDENKVPRNSPADGWTTPSCRSPLKEF